eukprot:74586_1
MTHLSHTDKSEMIETIVTCCLLLCYVILIAIALNAFSKHLNETVLKKRYAWITVLEAKLCIMQLFFRIPMEVGDGLYYISNNNSYLIMRQVSNLCHAICLQFLYYLLLSRFWLLYYDLGLVQSLLHNEWKYSIAPNTSPSINKQMAYNNQWYKSNKNTYGNFDWIFKNRILYILIITFLIGPLPFCISPLIFGLHSIQNHITLILDTCMDFAVCLILFIIRYNIPKINDNFFISKELKLIIYLMIFLVILGFILVANHFIFPNKSLAYFVITIIVRNLWYLDESCLMFVSMSWVLFKVKPIFTKFRLKKIHGVQYLAKRPINERESVASSLLMTNQKPIQQSILSNNENIQLQLIQALTNTVEFKTFMDYYSLDLSMKNLLAFIECIQYAKLVHEYVQYYNKNINIKDDEKNEAIIFLDATNYFHQIIYFCASVPKSTIVFAQGENTTYYLQMNRKDFLCFAKESAYLLFDKYINYGSYEVDISQTNRMEIANKMDNKDEWLNENISFQDLISLFDKVCREIFNSMTLSFYRFQKQKKEYNI